jgi:hypothetical protein
MMHLYQRHAEISMKIHFGGDFAGRGWSDLFGVDGMTSILGVKLRVGALSMVCKMLFRRISGLDRSTTSQFFLSTIYRCRHIGFVYMYSM